MFPSATLRVLSGGQVRVLPGRCKNNIKMRIIQQNWSDCGTDWGPFPRLWSVGDILTHRSINFLNTKLEGITECYR